MYARCPRGRPAVIAAEECKRFSDDCRSVGTDPNISFRRVAAALVVCRMLTLLEAEIVLYERIIAEER